MTNNRLNRLSLMFVHCDLIRKLNIDDIVYDFAREHLRHMEVVSLLTKLMIWKQFNMCMAVKA